MAINQSILIETVYLFIRFLLAATTFSALSGKHVLPLALRRIAPVAVK